MNPTLNAIEKTLNTALAELVEINKQMLQRANNERVEMLSLVCRMQETRNTVVGMASVYTEVAEELANMAEDNMTLAAKIGLAIDEPAVTCPDIPYENCIGFCDDCGAAIDEFDTYHEDDDGVGLVCNVCYNPED